MRSCILFSSSHKTFVHQILGERKKFIDRPIVYIKLFMSLGGGHRDEARLLNTLTRRGAAIELGIASTVVIFIILGLVAYGLRFLSLPYPQDD